MNQKFRYGLSIFNRPVHSSFTRLDRVQCSFVFIYLSMALNILYYQQNSSSSQYSLIDIEIVSFTIVQVNNH
jgi:hypothetical protein